jgi:protein TonB
MNRDLFLGVAVSVLLHSGTLLSDRFYDFGSKPAIQRAVERVIDVIDLPRFEPDDVERPPVEREEAVLTFVPPQQIDIPQAVTEGSITQMVQPPPPDVGMLPSGISTELFDDPRRAGPPGNIFEVSGLDQIPRVRGFRAPPNYPFEMRRTGLTGEVLVDFLVDAEGNVLNARAVTSSHREFEASAVQAVSKWKFHPGRKDGRNVITHMQIPIVFSLNPN